MEGDAIVTITVRVGSKSISAAMDGEYLGMEDNHYLYRISETLFYLVDENTGMIGQLIDHPMVPIEDQLRELFSESTVHGLLILLGKVPIENGESPPH